MFNLSEKRKFVRFEIPLTVMFREFGAQGNYFQAVASNFSREGLCLIAQEFPFDPNAMVEVKMDVPERDGALNISGEVMWRCTSDDRWQAGLRFREVDRTGKMDVLEYAYNSWLAKMRANR
jgi:hypothetical protein